MMKITKLEGWKKKTHQKDVTLNNSEDSTMSKIKKTHHETKFTPNLVLNGVSIKPLNIIIIIKFLCRFSYFSLFFKYIHGFSLVFILIFYGFH